MKNNTTSTKTFDTAAKPKGLVRLYFAIKNSSRAFAWLLKNEAAFRQEAAVLVIAILLSFLLKITATEQVLLIAAILFVMLVEIINTAIEAIVDRIGVELHPLSGLAKDLGSAAVSISLLLALLTWVVICFL